MSDDLTREELAELRALRKVNDDFVDDHGVPGPSYTALAQATYRMLPQLLDMAERSVIQAKKLEEAERVVGWARTMAPNWPRAVELVARYDAAEALAKKEGG